MKMTRYCVLQIQEDDVLRNTEIMFRPTRELVESLSMEYATVAAIDARSLDEVYLIGNCGMHDMYETLIERFQEMRSISVGDVIHNLETDEMFYVDRVGFMPCELKEECGEE